MSKFKLETLYNFSLIAHNNLGYKQTNESKLKISEPGDSNPVFVKIHSEETKGMMRKEREKDWCSNTKESELVSGFMTEHSAVIFVFFFLAEYASIILICILIQNPRK